LLNQISMKVKTHQVIIKAIQNSKTITQEDKTSALADIAKMRSDRKYHDRVNFSTEPTAETKAAGLLSGLFFWEKSELGVTFWIMKIRLMLEQEEG
jgi:hypothetical protein